MNAATRPACPVCVCTSPACLGYTCEPLPVERALELVRASPRRVHTPITMTDRTPAHAPPTDLDPALDEPVTPEMRARADAAVDAMRARWAARDAETDKANRAFDVAFRRALRRP